MAVNISRRSSYYPNFATAPGQATSEHGEEAHDGRLTRGHVHPHYANHAGGKRLPHPLVGMNIHGSMPTVYKEDASRETPGDPPFLTPETCAAKPGTHQLGTVSKLGDFSTELGVKHGKVF